VTSYGSGQTLHHVSAHTLALCNKIICILTSLILPFAWIVPYFIAI